MNPLPPTDAGRRRARVALAARLVAVATALTAAAALAQSPPATIESDRAELDRETGVSRYFGDVEFVRGELRLSGERVDVLSPDGRLREVEAQGEPARVRDRNEAGELVRGRARTIVYDAEAPLITLTGEAELERGGDCFNAALIRYRPDSGRLEAERDDGERVRITIQPATMEGSGAESGAESGSGSGSEDPGDDAPGDDDG